jgi:hypothetical protein
VAISTSSWVRQGPRLVDQLGLEQCDFGLGQGVVVSVADAADAGRGVGFGFGEPLGEPNRGLGSRAHVTIRGTAWDE